MDREEAGIQVNKSKLPEESLHEQIRWLRHVPGVSLRTASLPSLDPSLDSAPRLVATPPSFESHAAHTNGCPFGIPTAASTFPSTFGTST